MGCQYQDAKVWNGSEILRFDASRVFLTELDHVGRLLPDIERRWVAIARTDMQTACMATCRAVSQPDAGC